MKKVLVALLAAWSVASAYAADSAWMTDLPKAQAQAKSENKLVVMDFTGSDWCPWCIKLHKEVFDQPDFMKYASNNLVLVELDFPRTKVQPTALKEANKKLATQYKIEGFPTVIVLNAEGKKVDELGYEEGGAKPFIAKLDALKKK